MMLRHLIKKSITTSAMAVRGYAAATTSPAQHMESNIPTETNRLEKTAERFWEKVSVTPASSTTTTSASSTGAGPNTTPSGFYIQLDGKSVKTPGGRPLLIPSEKPALAHLIAHEWRILPSLKIKPHSLQLTSLAARAVDLNGEGFGTTDAGRLAQNDIVSALLPYLDTDTLLIFSPHKDCEGTLRPAQEKIYRPIIAAAEKFWGKSVVLSWLDTELCIAGNNQSPETKAVVGDWIKSLDPWELVSLERATMTAKSLISGMNIATHQMSVEDVAEACTLETIYQTQVWGEVEDTHDVDFHDIRRSLGSAYLLAYNR